MQHNVVFHFLALMALSSTVSAADDWGDDSWGDEPESSIELHGFIEAGMGGRIQTDPQLEDDDLTLAELRGRLESERYVGDIRLSAKLDLYADGVDDALQVNLREALADISLGQNADLRIGQQVLTWGTGDLLFLNDLFAKDWQSFFSGRDDEYLKAPSASLKLSYYGERANLDVVWTPVFTHDRFIEGERFSYFSPLVGQQVAAPQYKLEPESPDENLKNGEFAARFYGSSDLWSGHNTEWAIYAYKGFWKQPNALNRYGRAYFSPMRSLGASLRTNIADGIGYTELAWYEGEDDSGSDPFLPNDQLRFLLGYEQEVAPKLTLGLQYYREQLMDYSELAANDGDSPFRPDETRELWTVRMTYSLLQDNLVLSWFSFYSPTDQDYYHRPSMKYRFDDEWSLTVGGNIFGGEQVHTFFGQFEEASNLYARLRWSY